MSVKWCKVQVLKDGRSDWPFAYAVVAGSVSGFVGGMTQDFRTDEQGIAIVEWYSGDHLDKLFVSGQTFRGPFENGGTYLINYKV